ncbi:MAG: hypothetical protein ACYTKD_30415 [Planctomycetota bacterium]|jgi:hypothetical protein
MKYRKRRVRLRDLFSAPGGWPEETRSRPLLTDEDIFDDIMDQEIDIEALAEDCREAMLKDIARIAEDIMDGMENA